MPPTRNVGVFVGSLRKDSFTRKIASAIAKLAPSTLTLEFIEIAQLSHYNQDLENAPPADWVAFRQKASAVDAVLFATPEYNRSVPGVLKNAMPSRRGSSSISQQENSGLPGPAWTVKPGSAYHRRVSNVGPNRSPCAPL